MEERFWSKVDKKADDECWNWKGSLNEGYGQFKLNGKPNRAHRISFELHNKTIIPDDLIVRHKCDNPSCVNPHHLELGTQQDNVRDRVERGRSNTCYGEKCGAHKLTTEQVNEIKERLQMYEYGLYAKLAQEYNVSAKTISLIHNKKTWSKE
jgi:hypothetical protein